MYTYKNIHLYVYIYIYIYIYIRLEAEPALLGGLVLFFCIAPLLIQYLRALRLGPRDLFQQRLRVSQPEE